MVVEEYILTLLIIVGTIIGISYNIHTTNKMYIKHNKELDRKRAQRYHDTQLVVTAKRTKIKSIYEELNVIDIKIQSLQTQLKSLNMFIITGYVNTVKDKIEALQASKKPLSLYIRDLNEEIFDLEKLHG